MISISQIAKILRAYLYVEVNSTPTAVSINNNIPLYKCEKSGMPLICASCRKHHEAYSICSNFYSSIEHGEHEITCPFGVKIVYLRTNDAPMQIDYFLQIGFRRGNFHDGIIKDFNRIPKKTIKNALEIMPEYESPSTNFSSCFDTLKRISETLLAGRVAASMRTLTHEILTPVQGAMSDLQNIQYNHKNNNHTEDERILSLMQSNIEEINRIAKQVHILLSEDITPSPQRIRKVTVHKLIASACNRLESVAVQKNITFQNHFNGGIKAIDAVPDQLDIVFKCLLDNAAKYSFTGKPDYKRTIDIHYADINLNGVQGLNISIQNYGCLITGDEIKQRSIFELGYRGEFSGDRGRQGTGSGLFIVDSIVKAHHGEISVESKTDDNDKHAAINTFTVFWPKNFSEV